MAVDRRPSIRRRPATTIVPVPPGSAPLILGAVGLAMMAAALAALLLAG